MAEDKFIYPERAAQYLPMAQEANRKHGLPPGLMESLLYQESRYRTDIISGELKSGAGAEGIAQIVPKWHPGIDTMNPATSIDYAASYVAKLLKKYGNIEDALAAYNWGPGNMDKYGKEGKRPEETRNYITGIMGRIGGDEKVVVARDPRPQAPPPEAPAPAPAPTQEVVPAPVAPPVAPPEPPREYGNIIPEPAGEPPLQGPEIPWDLPRTPVAEPELSGPVLPYAEDAYISPPPTEPVRDIPTDFDITLKGAPEWKMPRKRGMMLAKKEADQARTRRKLQQDYRRALEAPVAQIPLPAEKAIPKGLAMMGPRRNKR